MEISKDTLPSMATVDGFRSVFKAFCCEILGEARLYPSLSLIRVDEARGAWQNDLHRVRRNEPHLGEGLDHFKQCGHLTFWVRRMSPVAEAYDLTKNYADAEGLPLSSDENALRELLFAYCNEYVAFELGYQLCCFYEVNKSGGSARASSLQLSEDYYWTMCHFLKYKNVSPHALFLIYKNLFYN